jgi:Protein of unknown function (DUF1156)
MTRKFIKTKPSFLETGLRWSSLSSECQSDNDARQRPPQNRLSVCWARCPLTICRVANLTALIPHDADLKTETTLAFEKRTVPAPSRSLVFLYFPSRRNREWPIGHHERDPLVKRSLPALPEPRWSLPVAACRPATAADGRLGGLRIAREASPRFSPCAPDGQAGPCQRLDGEGGKRFLPPALAGSWHSYPWPK